MSCDTDTEVSQEAVEIGPFKWTEGDRVELTWYVEADWSGTYTAQIRKHRRVTSTLIGEFTVVATYDGGTERTTFVMSIAQVDSADIRRGTYVTDVQSDDGLTRVWGECIVGPQVTA